MFPKVFPVIHSLLDAKITNVLSLCHDKTILAAVQSIIENMIACEDEKSQQQLHFLQVRLFLTAVLGITLSSSSRPLFWKNIDIFKHVNFVMVKLLDQ